MKTIFKYRLSINFTKPFKIEVPKGSKLLKVHSQGQSIQIWFETKDVAETEELFFITIETGAPLPSNPMKYLDTVFMYNNTYVIHVYQLT